MVIESPLFYLEKGTGSPIVLLHGLGADHRMYTRQLETLSQEFRVIVPDLRGNGQSPLLSSSPQDVLVQQAADLIALLDHLRLPAVHFVGISYGGVLCQELLTRYSERCRSAVICDSFADTDPHNLLERINSVAAGMTWPLTMPKSLRKALLGPSIQAVYRPWPGVGEVMLKYMLTDRAEETALQRLAISNLHNFHKLALVKVPVLCLYGDHSNILRTTMTELAQALPHSELQAIHNSLDPSNLCQPELWEKSVSEFLTHQERHG